MSWNIFDHGKSQGPLQSIGYLVGGVMEMYMLWICGMDVQAKPGKLVLWMFVLGYALCMLSQLFKNLSPNLSRTGIFATALSLRGLMVAIQFVFYGVFVKRWIDCGPDATNMSKAAVMLSSLIVMNSAFELMAIDWTDFSLRLGYLNILIFSAAVLAFFLGRLDCIGYAACAIACIAALGSFVTRIGNKRRRWSTHRDKKVFVGIALVIIAISLFLFQEFCDIQPLSCGIRLTSEGYSEKMDVLRDRVVEIIQFIFDILTGKWTTDKTEVGPDGSSVDSPTSPGSMDNDKLLEGVETTFESAVQHPNGLHHLSPECAGN